MSESEQKPLDLSRIQLIKNSTLNDLINLTYLEDLIIKLGFNTEILDEQPQIVKENPGGLLIWQYPNQFSKYLLLLKDLNINSYLEIGCRWGGSFILTVEYLKVFNNLNRSIAIDIIDSPVKNYCKLSRYTEFKQIDSKSQEFEEFINNTFFDLIFIDGDHSYDGVKNDYIKCKDSGRILVFHDIDNDACFGVIQFWNELKYYESNNYTFYEFKDQYNDVFQKTGKKYLGIGVMIKNN
jgi:precorrin-6B methylase 2